MLSLATLHSEAIVVAQGIAVLTIYVMLWDEISDALASVPRIGRYVLLVLLIAFMFATSNYSFQFAKTWGV